MKQVTHMKDVVTLGLILELKIQAPLTCFKVKLVSPVGMTITFMKIQMKFCRDLIFEPDQLFSLKKITSYPPLDTVIPKVILHSPVGVEI